MCFLKTLRPIQEIHPGISSKDHEAPNYQDSADIQKKQCLFDIQSKPKKSLVTQNDAMLFNLLGILNNNSLNIGKLVKNIQKNQAQIEETLSSMQQKRFQNDDEFKSNSDKTEEFEKENMIDSSDSLTETLFGKKQYKYKIELQETFPKTIFKERNISFGIKLTDINNNKVLNSNVAHICLGICDASGQWITENKIGESFMKGKTEIEMYHGQGSFLKIYPKDVSRGYPQGKIHFVIYAKPSLLKFSNNASSVEKIVKTEEIQPLIVKDLSIKAKKKQ